MILQAMSETRTDNQNVSTLLDLSFERCMLERLCASSKIVKVGVSYGHTVVWLTPVESVSWMKALGTFNGNIFIEFEIKADEKISVYENRDELLKELQRYELDDGRYLVENERAKRSARLVSLMKRLFNHRCMFCGFSIETGVLPYTEAHHVQELGKGGKDTPSNIAIVCPNHHQILHHGIAKEGLKLMFNKRIKQYFQEE